MKKSKSYPKTYPKVEKDIDKKGRPVHREYHKVEGFPSDFDKDRFGDKIAEVILHNVPERHLPYLKKRLGMTPKPAEKKQYKSLRRVYSFILAKAYLIDDHDEIKYCSVTDFNARVKSIFGIDKPRQYYLTVRSTYKGEKNFLNFNDEMAKAHPKDYDYAMMIYADYYPKIDKHFPKKK